MRGRRLQGRVSPQRAERPEFFGWVFWPQLGWSCVTVAYNEADVRRLLDQRFPGFQVVILPDSEHPVGPIAKTIPRQ